MTGFDIVRAIDAWQDRLGLPHWNIRPGDPARFHEGEPDGQGGYEAYVTQQPNERQALLYVHPDTPDCQVERIVVHELLHLHLNELLDPMRSVGEFTPGALDWFSELEERIINVLCTAFLPDVAWEPVLPEQRRRFEFDVGEAPRDAQAT